MFDNDNEETSVFMGVLVDAAAMSGAVWET
jgi:hypothetical protein